MNYVGSIAIDEDLLRRSDILPGEKVCVWNLNNGARLETYALTAPAFSGQIVINGAAARLCQRNDLVIIAAYLLTDEVVTPRMILVDAQNRFVRDLCDNQDGEVGLDSVTAPVDETVS